jgi:hypothetical protein
VSTHSVYDKYPGIIVALTAALVVVVGCGRTASTATPVSPTATPLPPTDTPLPPTLRAEPTRLSARAEGSSQAQNETDTPVSPTVTPVPPTNTPIPPTPTSTPRPTPTPRPPLSGSGGGVLAFVRTLDNGWGIYLVNADGSDQRRILFHGQGVAYPEWSPDGGQIAFHKHQSDQVWSINVMEVQDVLSGQGTGGSNEKRLTHTETQDAGPVWSPDGSQIAFSRDGDIWVMNGDGSDPRLLLDDPVYASGADWSPDGSQIVFESGRDGKAEIYVVQADGSNPQRLTHNDAEDWWPVWSPDGTQVAFMSDLDGDWEIFVMDGDGGNLRQLTHNEFDDTDPAWSPDGARIAFSSNRLSGIPFDTEIFIMESDGSNPQQITAEAGFEWGIDWWPATAMPALPPAAKPVLSFVDSRQRLGAGGDYLDAALGDLDGDGDLDAVIGNDEYEAGNAVLLNDGSGVLTQSGQSFGKVCSLALGDLDGDGDLDAFAVSFNRAGRIWLNDGGTFGDSGQMLGTVLARRVALGDLDGDGDLDAFVAREQENTVWLNDGQGEFSDSGQSLRNAGTEVVALGDLDGDGDLDALTGGWDEPGTVWLNDGAGSFSTSGQISDHDNIRDVALGDVDGDGDLDVCLTMLGLQSGWLWYNAGGVQGGTPGTFVDSGQSLSNFYVGGIALGDLDGDGDLDAFVGVDTGGTVENGSGNMVWLNSGGIQGGTPGVFTDSGLRLGEASSQGVVLGDLDGDGDLDALVVNREDFSVPLSHPEALITSKVWFNTTPGSP